MGKRITLTESQFKDYIRIMKLNEDMYGENGDLEIEQIDQLLHKMVDNDFLVYFPNGRVYNCNYTNVKGDVFDAVCGCIPRINEKNGRLILKSDKYGVFEMDNLLGGFVPQEEEDNEDDYEY